MHRFFSRPFVSVLAAGALLALSACQTPPAAGGATGSQPSPAAVSSGAGSSVEQVEFFVGQAQPADGLTALQVQDGTLYIQRIPVMTRADLREAVPLVDKQGKNFVGLRFTDAGAHKLNEISTQNIGKVLAVVVGRDLVAAPRITEPMNRGVVAFAVPSAQDADRIAARIRGQ